MSHIMCILHLGVFFQYNTNSLSYRAILGTGDLQAITNIIVHEKGGMGSYIAFMRAVRDSTLARTQL